MNKTFVRNDQNLEVLDSQHLHVSLTAVQVNKLKLRAVESKYRKNSKNWDTLNHYRDCPTNGIVGFYSAILRSKDADRITNRADTDQTAPRGAV